MHEGQFAFSQEGSLIYQSISDPGLELAWVDRQAERTVFEWDSDEALLSFRFSPDGQRLAFTRDGDIYVKPLDKNTPIRLTFDESHDGFAIWHPLTDHIVFSSGRDQELGGNLGGPSDLYKIRADGEGEVERLTTGPRMLKVPTSISPDGKHLAFTALDAIEASTWNIWTLALEDPGAEPEPFLETEAAEMNAVFSPDGKWVAYSSTETGRGRVYALPFPKAPGRRPISTQDGTGHPMWLNDEGGSEFFYYRWLGVGTGLDMVGGEIYSIRFSGAGPERPRAKPEALFWMPTTRIATTRTFDVTPDGERFLMVLQKEGLNEGPQLVWVQNWFEELKRLVPRKR